MTKASLALTVALSLSVLYGVLAIIAFSHIKAEEKSRQSYWLLVMDVWWPYYGNKYDESARRACFYGKLLFPIIVASYVAWVVLRTY